MTSMKNTIRDDDKKENDNEKLTVKQDFEVRAIIIKYKVFKYLFIKKLDLFILAFNLNKLIKISKFDSIYVCRLFTFYFSIGHIIFLGQKAIPKYGFLKRPYLKVIMLIWFIIINIKNYNY